MKATLRDHVRDHARHHFEFRGGQKSKSPSVVTIVGIGLFTFFHHVIKFQLGGHRLSISKQADSKFEVVVELWRALSVRYSGLSGQSRVTNGKVHVNLESKCLSN